MLIINLKNLKGRIGIGSVPYLNALGTRTQHVFVAYVRCIHSEKAHFAISEKLGLSFDCASSIAYMVLFFISLPKVLILHNCV
jgi:hypothetical protein